MEQQRTATSAAAQVAEAIAGDEHARASLWQSHRRWLAAILLSYKPREIDLEDLMQDVAIKFVSKLHTLRDAGAFKPWLRRIAINAARESARSIKNVRNRRSVEASDAESNLRQHESMVSDDEARALLAHARTLPPEFREPLLLRCVRGMGCRQIAEILDLPITTIETRLSRARRMLRDEWLDRLDREQKHNHQSQSSDDADGRGDAVPSTGHAHQNVRRK